MRIRRCKIDLPLPVYSAIKAFFRSFTLSLRALVKAKGVEVIEVIPPALNTGLGGKGLHDHAPSVSGSIDAIFEQLKQNGTDLRHQRRQSQRLRQRFAYLVQPDEAVCLVYLRACLH
ncbi:Rossmann-fold NAD(P)-binding domain-containing protein [Spirosoma validum]|uniref:SDR family NAD(P)-dependent oxidoreductase n=1 Tax=Spirosoma validum TaxID=2771355 RepID=A0A927GGI8_9BACT|nr:hypothetical protein [Spirosoma validum]MBD2756655.1 hypothetical protein [Spirosoma validum]